MKNKNTIKGPIVIGGIGGSGTRVVASILRELRIFIGNDLNIPLDNLSYTLLFKRSKWFYSNFSNKSEIEKGLCILEKKMTNLGHLTLSDYWFLIKATSQMYRYGHNVMKDGSGEWAIERFKALVSCKVDLESYLGWGWKEPNSHLILNHMDCYFSEFKYIHAIRNGLDMAFSNNQQQLFNWAKLYNIETPQNAKDIPNASFQYWLRANMKVIEYGNLMGNDRFFLLNFDQLCIDPVSELQRLLTFLNIAPNEEIFMRLIELLKVPKTLGRYKNHNLDWFMPEYIPVIEQMGFKVDVAI